MTPPTTPITVDSSRNSRRIRLVRAPTAFLRPISRTRSVTAISIVLITEIPPMTSANRAATVVIAVNVAPPALNALTSVLGFVALTPATLALISSASLSRS